MTETNPFKWVESISRTKVDMIQSEEDAKGYNAYMVNRALSLHLDCVLYANQMNSQWELDSDMQYQFLRSAIRSKKRFSGKWPKRAEDACTRAVAVYYGVGAREAAEIVDVLSADQLDMIRSEIESREGTS